LKKSLRKSTRKTSKKLKPCAEGKVRNKETGRCRLKKSLRKSSKKTSKRKSSKKTSKRKSSKKTSKKSSKSISNQEIQKLISKVHRLIDTPLKKINMKKLDILAKDAIDNFDPYDLESTDMRNGEIFQNALAGKFDKIIFEAIELLSKKSLIGKNSDFEKFRKTMLSKLEKLKEQHSELLHLLTDEDVQLPNEILENLKKIRKQVKKIEKTSKAAKLEMISKKLKSLM
jgi:hypothetical protein